VRDQLAYLASQFDFLAFLQIVFVAAIFHGVLTLIRGTQADTLLRGVVALVVLILVVGRVFQLTLINWLLVNALPGIILVVAILFAPELRRMLERVGRTSGLLVRPFAALDQTALDPRSVDETLRVVKALGTGRLCPADWRPGEPTLDPDLRY